MKKIVIHSAGGHDKLKLEEHQLGDLKMDEIRVEVKYSGVNYADVCVRWGIYESAKQYVGWPITPGFEFSGIVTEVASNNSQFKVGDEVFGVKLFDSYASEVIVPEHQLFHKPKQLSFAQAACFPAVFLTAYHGLFQNFVFRKKSKVLIHSAAGGVGTSLVQLAKWHDCEVVGVIGSSHKAEHLKSLGIDHVIDKSKEDLWKRASEISPQGYDVVLDANGVKTLKDSFNHLRPTGKLVVYGFHTMLSKGSSAGKLNFLKVVWNYLKTPRFNPIDLTAANKSVLAFNLSFLFEHKEILSEAMETLLDLVEKEVIVGHPISEFDAAQVGEAHKHIESGLSIGKIALKWS
jgi:NADPH:quinone reductase-like Zn-dependent oxidoreductase